MHLRARPDVHSERAAAAPAQSGVLVAARALWKWKPTPAGASPRRWSPQRRGACQWRSRSFEVRLCSQARLCSRWPVQPPWRPQPWPSSPCVSHELPSPLPPQRSGPRPLSPPPSPHPLARGRLWKRVWLWRVHEPRTISYLMRKAISMHSGSDSIALSGARSALRRARTLRATLRAGRGLRDHRGARHSASPRAGLLLQKGGQKGTSDGLLLFERCGGRRNRLRRLPTNRDGRLCHRGTDTRLGARRLDNGWTASLLGDAQRTAADEAVLLEQILAPPLQRP